MAVVKLTLEYDGTGFSGWAAQPGLRTVESELRAALDVVYPSWQGLAVAGRTDAGVHALALVAAPARRGLARRLGRAARRRARLPRLHAHRDAARLVPPHGPGDGLGT